MRTTTATTEKRAGNTARRVKTAKTGQPAQPEKVSQDQIPTAAETQVKLTRITPNQFNPRRGFDEQGLRELAENIRQMGLIHAITVRSDGEQGYVIVCGERRYRAALLAEMKTIRVNIKNLSDSEAEDYAIAENLQREDITPFEQGMAFKRQIDNKRYDVEGLSKQFGRSREFVLNRIRLLDLIPEIVGLLDSEDITMSIALECARYEPEIQREIFERHLREGAVVQWRHLKTSDFRHKLSMNYLTRLDTFFFDKTECATCASNKANQVLFAQSGDDQVCQNRVCMMNKNREYLIAEVRRLLSEDTKLRIGIFNDCSHTDIITALESEGIAVKRLGYHGYYDKEPSMPQEPRPENFVEEIDYRESCETYRSAMQEYEHECSELANMVKAELLVRYATLGDRQIEFYYDEPEVESVSDAVPIYAESPNEYITVEGERVDMQTGEVIAPFFTEPIEALSEAAVERNNKISAQLQRLNHSYTIYKEHLADNTRALLRKIHYNSDWNLQEEESRILYYLMLDSVDRSNYSAFGIDENKVSLTNEEKLYICLNLTPEQQTLILREFIRSQLRVLNPFSGLNAILAGDFVDLHDPDAFKSMKSSMQSIYNQRYQSCLNALSELNCNDTPENELEKESCHVLSPIAQTYVEYEQLDNPESSEQTEESPFWPDESNTPETEMPEIEPEEGPKPEQEQEPSDGDMEDTPEVENDSNTSLLLSDKDQKSSQTEQAVA